MKRLLLVHSALPSSVQHCMSLLHQSRKCKFKLQLKSEGRGREGGEMVYYSNNTAAG